MADPTQADAEDLVGKAVSFLSSATGRSAQEKEKFLVEKGLTQEQIQEAYRRLEESKGGPKPAPGPTPPQGPLPPTAPAPPAPAPRPPPPRPAPQAPYAPSYQVPPSYGPPYQVPPAQPYGPPMIQGYPLPLEPPSSGGPWWAWLLGGLGAGLAGTYLANPFQLKPEDFDPREFFSEGPRETPKVDSEPKQSDAEPDGKANYEELLALLRQQSEEAKANVAMCAKTLQQTQEQHQKMFSEMQKALQQLTQPKSTKPQTMELSALRPNDAAWARNVGHALQMFVKVVSQKEGKSEEEVLQELSTPAGMEMFAKMLSTSASGAVGSLKKTQMLAASCERINIYLEAINKHCPWLMEETEEEHGCGFTDCKGESQRLFFGLDLASANAFYPSRFTMCLPKVRWYASEHLADGSYLGTKMMDDCLEYMTTAPEEEPRKRPRRETVDLLGVEDGVQKGENDESEGGDSDASELEEFLTSLGTNDSREAAKLLRGRAACVDVTEETWHTVEHLQGRCSVVTCTSLLTQVEGRVVLTSNPTRFQVVPFL
ncbi:unnamed protein product [Effrenium voratum]|uniref:Peroxisomal membrane protein PEX14 n=1 Tax=Effrenium voratum TaxID=2562239 RepID=A0AA36MPF2_9DINO|nr:unnamed protein product [Effrenium voratum]